MILTEQEVYRAKHRVMTAEHLRAWMAWHGLGQTDVAKACKVDRRTVYNWLHSKHAIPRTVWPSLAQQFGDPLPQFVGPNHASGDSRP